MAIKPLPNHGIYIRSLRRLSSEQKLAKTFELSEMSRRLFREGLRRRFPDLTEDEFHRLYLERLALCHNRNY